MDQEAKMAQAKAAAAEMAETLKLERVLPIINMQEAKALLKLHEEHELKGFVELNQGLSIAVNKNNWRSLKPTCSNSVIEKKKKEKKKKKKVWF